jgi:hypothetical protein
LLGLAGCGYQQIPMLRWLWLVGAASQGADVVWPVLLLRDKYSFLMGNRMLNTVRSLEMSANAVFLNCNKLAAEFVGVIR